MATIKRETFKNEFIYCYFCKEQFVWLKCYPQDIKGIYVVACRKCRLKEDVNLEIEKVILE